MIRGGRIAARPRLSVAIADRNGTGDSPLIETARKRFDLAKTAETPQRERELQDLEFYAGQQWPQDVLDARRGIPGNALNGIPPVPARPSLTINKVREPVRQILNGERDAELGVEIVATDDWGDNVDPVTKEEIELREGLVRRIQRESQAKAARSWAFMRAVIAGRGFYRVSTRYAPRSMDQNVSIDLIYNQACVTLDPAHQQPDGSDADWEFIWQDMTWEDYIKTFPRAARGENALRGMSSTDWRQLGDELPNWFSGGQGRTARAVRVGEYYYAKKVPVEWVQLASGAVVKSTELKRSDKVARDEDGREIRREDTERIIKWVKLDGVQVLERTDWPSTYMPIIKVVGEELQPFDNDRRTEGMVRPARDSNRGFNVMVSKWVEQIGLAPIPPWIGAAGFDEGFESEWALSTTRTLAALHYNQWSSGDNPTAIPPPTRTSISMDIQAIAGSVQLFDAAIKSTTAVPDPTLGNVDPRIRSNAGLKTAITQAQQSTSHFLDNLTRSIRYEGIVTNDLLYPVYGRPDRLTRMVNKSGDSIPVQIGRPFLPEPKTGRAMVAVPSTIQAPAPAGPAGAVPPGGPGATAGPLGTLPVTPETPGAKVYTLSKDATFELTVKVVKNAETRRQAQEAMLAELVQADPTAMGIVGDLLWKYSDAPGHEELEERYRVVLVPAVQALLNGSGGPLPPQVQQQLAQAAQLQGEFQKLLQIVQQKQIEQEGMLKGKLIDQQTRIKVAWITALANLAAVDAKVDAENARTVVEEDQEGAIKALDLRFQKFENAADRLHDRAMAHEAQAHEAAMAGASAAHATLGTALDAALAPATEPTDTSGDAAAAEGGGTGGDDAGGQS